MFRLVRVCVCNTFCFLSIGRRLVDQSTQGLAEGNSALANRTALEAKEARAKAGQRAEQAEAQVKKKLRARCGNVETSSEEARTHAV